MPAVELAISAHSELGLLADMIASINVNIIESCRGKRSTNLFNQIASKTMGYKNEWSTALPSLVLEIVQHTVRDVGETLFASVQDPPGIVIVYHDSTGHLGGSQLARKKLL